VTARTLIPQAVCYARVIINIVSRRFVEIGPLLLVCDARIGLARARREMPVSAGTVVPEKATSPGDRRTYDYYADRFKSATMDTPRTAVAHRQHSLYDRCRLRAPDLIAVGGRPKSLFEKG